jgi:hypothetical protein
MAVENEGNPYRREELFRARRVSTRSTLCRMYSTHAATQRAARTNKDRVLGCRRSQAVVFAPLAAAAGPSHRTSSFARAPEGAFGGCPPGFMRPTRGGQSTRESH